MRALRRNKYAGISRCVVYAHLLLHLMRAGCGSLQRLRDTARITRRPRPHNTHGRNLFFTVSATARPTTEPDGNLRGFNSVEILTLLYTCPHTTMYGSLLDPRAARSSLLCCNPPIRPQRRSSHQHAADVLVRLSGLFQRLVGLLARGP